MWTSRQAALGLPVMGEHATRPSVTRVTSSSEGADPPPPALTAPVVPAEVYVEDYYRSHCGGHEAWWESAGARSDGMYSGFLDRAGFTAGEVLVDLGCGRGELMAVAVARGAARAIGVEYSADAVCLAQQTLERAGRLRRVYTALARLPSTCRRARG